MHRKDLRAFHILEEFETNQAVNQRQLAQKLEISLGSMNAALQELKGKGFFTVDYPSTKQKQYTLTPAGITEKARLYREYLELSLYYYRFVRNRLSRLLAALEKEGLYNIGFCGLGFLSEIAYICLQRTQLRLNAIIEDDSQYERYFDVPVIPMKAIDHFAFDIILITTVDSVERRINQMRSHGVTQKKLQLIWH